MSNHRHVIPNRARVQAREQDFERMFTPEWLARGSPRDNFAELGRR